MAQERQRQKSAERQRTAERYEEGPRRERPAGDPWRWYDLYGGRGPGRDYRRDFESDFGTGYGEFWGGHYGDPLPISHYGWPMAPLPPRRPPEDRYRDHPDRGGRDFMDRAADEVYSWFGDEAAERRRWRDRHRGKGPKGYTRSDERILEEVNDRLTQDGEVDASDIAVSVKKGEVTLNGTVFDRYEKRRAEDCADSVSGVRNTQNNLRIEQPAVPHSP